MRRTGVVPRGSCEPVKQLKVMFVDVRPLFEAVAEPGMPIPDVGDEVEIKDSRYVVVARVWTLEPYSVAIYVRETG